MSDNPGILFPHMYMPETGLRRVLSLFLPLTVFQPWFMDRSPDFEEGEGSGVLRILTPPEDMKPEEGFPRLLNEFRTWITQNRDRSYNAFLSAEREGDESEARTWEIRGALRRTGGEPEDQSAGRTLRRHLVLHLAREWEYQRLEADRAMADLKKMKSPLKGIVEEEDPRGLFDDLPGFNADPLMSDYHLEQVVEAWFGLFGGYLEEGVPLVTCDPHIMDFVSDLWMEGCGPEFRVEMSRRTFRFPDLSHYPLEELIRIRGEKLKEAIGRVRDALLKGPGPLEAGGMEYGDGWAEQIEEACPRDLADGTLRVTFKDFCIPADLEGPFRKRGLGPFFGKRIALVEEGSRDG